MVKIKTMLIRTIIAWSLITLLLNACALLPEPPEPPNVTLSDLKIIDVTIFEQRYRVQLRIQNTNNYPLPIIGMNFKLQLNDKHFAQGVSNQSVNVAAFSDELLTVDVVSNLSNIIEQLQTLSSEVDTAFRYRLSGKLTLSDHIRKVPFEHLGEITLSSPASSNK